MAGFYGLHVHGDAAEGTHLFVDPPVIGTGVGRALWHHLVAVCARRGVVTVLIDADPDAVGFYLAMGAERAGQRRRDRSLAACCRACVTSCRPRSGETSAADPRRRLPAPVVPDRTAEPPLRSIRVGRGPDPVRHDRATRRALSPTGHHRAPRSGQRHGSPTRAAPGPPVAHAAAACCDTSTR